MEGCARRHLFASTDCSHGVAAAVAAAAVVVAPVAVDDRSRKASVFYCSVCVLLFCVALRLFVCVVLCVGGGKVYRQELDSQSIRIS